MGSYKRYIWLGFIVVLFAFSLFIALPIEHPQWALNLLRWQPEETRDLEIKQGLDLRGGIQVLLEAEPAAGQELTEEDMEATKVVITNRINALGVVEPLVQLQGDRRIIVELPGIDNPNLAIDTLRSTGQLEFAHIDLPGQANVPQGAFLRTTLEQQRREEAGLEPEVPLPPEAETDPQFFDPYPDRVFPTIMTGANLRDARVGFDDVTMAPLIQFDLDSEGARIFGDHTSQNVGRVLAIVLDGRVLSAPVIQSPITGGSGVITGRFTLEEAQSLAVQMRYGALRVPLQVIDNRTVGPTLGQESVERSITAGTIGVIVVLFFMISYYRLPGVLASVALLLYVLMNFSVYKLIPITLTLPGIAGFLLSTGMAVDANILIFERMKEELRSGRSLGLAVEAGFSRAWTSIRDSNLSTMITCLILWYFGTNFGASQVQGFAITLFIGVGLSMFTAITITRAFMRFTFHGRRQVLATRAWLMGV